MTQNLVFVGGGHSHAIALRMWGMNPLPGVRVVLISDVTHTPYSGMLPGYIAGFYNYDQCHIDLRALANFAQAQFICDRAVGLDLANNRVICAHSPPVAFDILSLDIGSTPEIAAVPGAADYAIPAKPVPNLLYHWHQLLEAFKEKPLKIGIVGGGAGGVELALSMSARFNQILAAQYPPSCSKPNSSNFQVHLCQRSPEILPNHSTYVRKNLAKFLTQRGILLHLKEKVTRIAPRTFAPSPVIIYCESGFTLECDRLFWVTQASAPSWLGASGLSTDSAGFIQVRNTLQSISHSHIFATGDIATMIDHPRPKAGVFAVRQGLPLYKNLRRILQGRPLKPFKPQKNFLTLIGTGEGSAFADRGVFGLGPSPLLWYWKDWIDRQFMEKFRHFPKLEPAEPDSANPTR